MLCWPDWSTWALFVHLQLVSVESRLAKDVLGSPNRARLHREPAHYTLHIDSLNARLQSMKNTREHKRWPK